MVVVLLVLLFAEGQTDPPNLRVPRNIAIEHEYKNTAFIQLGNPSTYLRRRLHHGYGRNV